MLKTLLISTLVAVGCVLSSGAGAHLFSDYFKFELIESQGESDAECSPPSTIHLGLFRRCIQNLGPHRRGENPDIYRLLEGGGRITIQFSGQNSWRTDHYNLLTVHIFGPFESWKRQIRLTLTDKRTCACIPFVYQPSLWINESGKPDSAERMSDCLRLNQIFIDRVRARIDTVIRLTVAGSPLLDECRHGEFSSDDSEFIINVDPVSWELPDSQPPADVSADCGTGASSRMTLTEPPWNSTDAPAGSNASGNDVSQRWSLCPLLCPRGSLEETVYEQLTFEHDQEGGEAEGSESSSYNTTGDEDSDHDANHEGLENDQDECECGDPPEGSTV